MVMMLMPPADASRDSKRSEWSTPVNLGAAINTAFGEAAPAISRDGLTLYFVSNPVGNPNVPFTTTWETADGSCRYPSVRRSTPPTRI